MKKNLRDLEKEQQEQANLDESLEKNPVKKVIQALFSGPFHGTAYRKYSITQIKGMVVDQVEAVLNGNASVYSGGGRILLTKIKKTKTIDEALICLNEYLFS